MIDFRLIASTVGKDADPNSYLPPEKQWLEEAATFPVSRPGRLSFLVFEIDCNYLLEDRYFVGLDSFESDRGVIVAGRVEDFERAANAIGRDDPHDIRSFFDYVKQKLRDFGYGMRSTL